MATSVSDPTPPGFPRPTRVQGRIKTSLRPGAMTYSPPHIPISVVNRLKIFNRDNHMIIMI